MSKRLERRSGNLRADIVWSVCRRERILSATPSTAACATWYCWLLTGFYLYSVNLQGNVVPFLQAEFALSYRAVSLHSSAIAVGIILVGLLGDKVEAGLGRRRTLWLGICGHFD